MYLLLKCMQILNISENTFVHAAYRILIGVFFLRLAYTVYIVNMSSGVRLQRLVFCSIRLVYMQKTKNFVPLQISIY